MRILKSLTLVLVIQLMINLSLLATGDSLHYLLPTDTLFLSIDNYGEKNFTHYMEQKQTLYSLSSFYGLSVEELYYYNQGLKEASIKLHQGIRVPIPNRSIRRYMTENLLPSDYIPIFYIVKKGDTMYRIAKVYFRIPINEMLARNNLESVELKVGQLLHVGWININGISEDSRKNKGGPMARRNFAMKKVYLRDSNGKKEKTQRGPAAWKKNSKEESDLYALHRYARKNSVIAVENPMSKRTVYVKVIGKIPDAAFGYDVKVVLSPLAAKLLGAKDPRFFVHVKYYK